jgi:hypothetical protein
MIGVTLESEHPTGGTVAKPELSSPPTMFCPECGKQGTKQLTADDKAKIEQIEKRPIPFWYPKDVRLSYVDGMPFKKREKSEYVHELFTKLNIVTLTSMKN